MIVSLQKRFTLRYNMTLLFNCIICVFSGTGQNVKPPPLNMLSGSKLSRNTATVPPLNQTSPSNGLTSNNSNAALNATRTSSFAAALRKLAHQAKDPGINSMTG